MTGNPDCNKPLPFSKIVEQDDQPLGVAANSRTFHENYDSLLVVRTSDENTWPFDPEDDSEAMRLFHEGRTAQYERDLPSPIEAAGLYSAALRLRKDFARAWLNLSVARVQMRDLEGAEKILRMLIDKVEQSGDMRMTQRARHMVHLNFGTVKWLCSEVSQGAERQSYLEEADREYALADELNGFADTGDLFNRLVVQVELGRITEQNETVRRINAYLKEHGGGAKEVAQDYIAKFPRQLSAIVFEFK